jgi:hypothetical protein
MLAGRLNTHILYLQVITEVDFAELKQGLPEEKVAEIKATGSVIVRGVIPEEKVRLSNHAERYSCANTCKALEWLESIKHYIALNPDVKGFPEDNKAVYEL